MRHDCRLEHVAPAQRAAVDRRVSYKGLRCGLVVVSLASLLAACAQPPQQRLAGRSKEYFPSSRYGNASPRVVAEGEAVPRGGGQYLVGRPYSIAGRRYVPTEQPRDSQIGMASYYGAAFHGRRTANGEVYDMAAISAAHPTMPLPSYARVTNTRNGKSIIVRVNDRGPYHGGRVMDVSSRVAELLDFKRMGTAQIKVDYVGRAGLEGSDDRRLLASLRTDGSPATLDGSPNAPRTMIARQDEPAPRPEPMPVRVAELTPPRQPEAIAVTTSNPVVAPLNAMPARAPLPPSRPFDLGTIPGAGVPIAARPSATPDSSAITRILRSDESRVERTPNARLTARSREN